MLSRRSTRLAILAVLAAAAPLSAQDPEEAQEEESQTLQLVGRLLDHLSERPVVGAVVRLAEAGPEGGPLEQVTDESGEFVFEEAPVGTWLFEVEHIGYGLQSDSVTLPEGRSLSILVRVAADPIELEPLAVTVRSSVLENAGFYERRDDGFGQFLTRDDIARHDASQLSMIVGMLAGVRKVPGPFGTYRLQMNRVGGRTCRIQYYLDGVPTLLGSIGIDEIPPYDVEGVEVYRGASEVPPQFNTRNALCGVIVIWTRIE